MLESMTGYGRAEHSEDNIKAIAEVSSVNFRYCEIVFKMPECLHHFEPTLKMAIQKKIGRGKINISVRLEDHSSESKDFHLEKELLSKRILAIKKIGEFAGISEPIKFEHLLQFDDIFDFFKQDTGLMEKKILAAETAVTNAVDMLIKMRKKEGMYLQADLEKRIEQLKKHCNMVEKSEKNRIHDVKQKLEERLSQLLGGFSFDKERLEQEVVLMADRLDISEEMVRMNAHISFFLESLESGVSSGKKLNFILQEMHREVNTMGSKANNSQISRNVVEMKEIIENLREQIQNIS